MADEYDLKIVDGDLAFGPDDEPVFVADAAAVAQDVKHRLEESGLTAELVGDDADPQSVLDAIAFEVEEDLRIKPGTAAAEVTAPGKVSVTAKTMDDVEIQVEL